MSCLLYFPRKSSDREGFFEELFRARVKRKGQDKFHKVEIRKGFHREYDVIEREEVQDKVIESYSKEVKSRELRIWKGNMRSLTGTVSDDGHLLIGDEPRKKNFQELRETSTLMPMSIYLDDTFEIPLSAKQSHALLDSHQCSSRSSAVIRPSCTPAEEPALLPVIS